MKYPLDCEENFEKSFLFWLAKYVKESICFYLVPYG